MKILLIDDDRSIQALLERVLTAEGYTFVGALSGKEGLALLESERPDLLLLDIMLPGTNGFDLCAHIRGEGRRIPIIMLSAKGDIVDKSIGFKAGCDDYVVKPFNADELLLRVEANIRRHKEDLRFIKPVNKRGSLKVGELEIVFDHYEAYLRGEKINLTSKEFEILALLATDPGKVFTRAQIYKHIWGTSSEITEDSITVFVRRIREKIEHNPSEPVYLLTVWRVGYKFAEHL
ncbi:MAG: response regulator transcription factor [Coriobacteriales bacterium]|nr:response regulator transcription factor [Coriobacteriales bacterium]